MRVAAWTSGAIGCSGGLVMGKSKFIWGVVLLVLGLIMIVVGVMTTGNPGSATVNQSDASFWYVLIPGMAVAVGGASLLIYEAFHHAES
jgi:hypothetical protein